MIAVIAFVVALVLTLVDEARARGQSLTDWAIVFVCIGLLWGKLG